MLMNLPMTSLMNPLMPIIRFTNTKLRDGVTELSLPKIQTDMLKDYDR